MALTVSYLLGLVHWQAIRVLAVSGVFSPVLLLLLSALGRYVSGELDGMWYLSSPSGAAALFHSKTSETSNSLTGMVCYGPALLRRIENEDRLWSVNLLPKVSAPVHPTHVFSELTYAFADIR